ncbi:hypothetical protein CC86DRAFT_458744 [Ophiobolus disseminans]|uniref:Uncharacterized protein n=1 Tax=Ophiobolus disseminans TaxID=1469910 RepID=A0A6A6ZN59_9PLEO|nr:hypothetical protein CC86DRAFT_458744 [Ophiobolus disseminans]
MESRARFSNAQPHDPEDDTSSSHEMLRLRNPSANHDNKSASWTVEASNSPTLREKWSPFPYRTTLIILLLPLALTPVITLSVAAEVASQSYIRGRDCYPNGLWKFSSTATWEIMDSSYFFTPNLSFGAMSFTQVKVIDVAWDLLVGRGGQLALAWVNWRVFNEWMVWHAEQHGTSWKMYAAVAFETTSLGTLGVLVKEFLSYGKGSWKRFFRWLGLVCMFFSTLYVLSFPTLMAAATGYIAKSEPYVGDYDGNLITFGKVDAVQYVVNDAGRVGYDRPLVVGARDLELGLAVRKYMVALAPENISQTLLFPTLRDTYRSRKFSVNTTSRWLFDGKSIELPSPSLNITISPISIRSDQKNDRIVPGSDSLFVINGRQGELYEPAWMLEHGSCKPGEEYQWGFSYIFLFMVSIFNFVWACIMVGMWYDTRRGSRMYRGGRRPGLLRSIVEYAAAIREEIGENVDGMEEEELRERLRKSQGSLGVPIRELRVRRVDTGDGEEDMRKRGWTRSLTRGSTF